MGGWGPCSFRMDPGVTSEVYSFSRNAWGLEALCVRTDLPTPSRDLSYVVSWRRLTATVTEDVNGDGLCVLPRTGGRAVSAQKVPSLSGNIGRAGLHLLLAG